MTELETTMPATRRRSLHFDWILPTFIRPQRTLTEVTGQTRSAWLTPMLILTLLVLGASLIGGPLRRAAAVNKPPEIPPNFQYYSPEDQQRILESQKSDQGPTFTYVFPAVSAVAGVWIGWLLLGGILHLVLTLLGSRSSTIAAMNLAAWASLPLGLRSIVQAIAMLAGRSLISKPGLSGFIPAGAGGGLLFLGFMLAAVDLYLIWQAALLGIGARSMSGLKPGKVVLAVGITLLLLLALQALPPFAGAKLSGLKMIQPFFF